MIPTVGGSGERERKGEVDGDGSSLPLKPFRTPWRGEA